MNVVLLSKFRQGLVATECLKRHFGLEHRGMVPTGSFHGHCSFQLSKTGPSVRIEQFIHLCLCPKNRGHLYLHEINHKVVQRLHQEWGLPLMRNIKPPKPSGIRQVIEAAGGRINLVAEKGKIEPFEVAYADFTELVCSDGNCKAYLMPIVDHGSKMVLGWAVGDRAVTELALQAWEYARETLIDYGIDLKKFILHHDQDPVFTGYRWTARLLLKDHIRVSYALNGARDNPEMEGFNSRFKTENRSLVLDAQTLGELQLVVRERMAYHNQIRRHSTIGYLAPVRYVETQSLRS